MDRLDCGHYERGYNSHLLKPVNLSFFLCLSVYVYMYVYMYVYIMYILIVIVTIFIRKI